MDLIFEYVWGTSIHQHFQERLQEHYTDQDILNEIVRGIRLLRKYERWMSVHALRDTLYIVSGPHKGCRIPKYASAHPTSNYTKCCEDCHLYFWSTCKRCKICNKIIPPLHPKKK